ncbi:MAG TPA: peroxiredoxin-like family protein [Terriglobales bacterium]|nr:peroxiredoxin-like family protein [Terriglobales bacterium]
MKWRGLEEAEAAAQCATLQEELDQRRAMAEQYVPAATQAIHRQTIDSLRASGISRHSLSRGAQAPSFELPDQNGNLVSSASLLSGSKLVVCFFRGRWCPFCVAQMEAMNRIHPQIKKAGAELIAISPQTVRQGFFMQDQHGIHFPLLSDANNQVARQFGLVYRVPEPQQKIYSTTFVNLPFINGEDSWELPAPGTYILGKEHEVLYASADPDYTRRPEPAEILSSLAG